MDLVVYKPKLWEGGSASLLNFPFFFTVMVHSFFPTCWTVPVSSRKQEAPAPLCSISTWLHKVSAFLAGVPFTNLFLHLTAVLQTSSKNLQFCVQREMRWVYIHLSFKISPCCHSGSIQLQETFCILQPRKWGSSELVKVLWWIGILWLESVPRVALVIIFKLKG